MKYNYFEMKKSRTALPADINKPVEIATAAVFGHEPEELLKILTEYREKRRFGTIEMSEGNVAVQINFVSGIIPEFVLIGTSKTAKGVILHKRTVKNDHLTYPKTLNGEKQ